MRKTMKIAKKVVIRFAKDIEAMIDNLLSPALLSYVLFVVIYV